MLLRDHSRLYTLFSARTQRKSPGTKARFCRTLTARLKSCPDTKPLNPDYADQSYFSPNPLGAAHAANNLHSKHGPSAFRDCAVARFLPSTAGLHANAFFRLG